MSEEPYVVARGHWSKMVPLPGPASGYEVELDGYLFDYSDGRHRETWTATLDDSDGGYIILAEGDSDEQLSSQLWNLGEFIKSMGTTLQRPAVEQVDDEQVVKNRMAANPLVAREVIEERAEERRTRWRAAEAESSTTQVAPGNDGATPGRITMSDPFDAVMPALPALPSGFMEEFVEPTREPITYQDTHTRALMDHFDATIRRHLAAAPGRSLTIPAPPAFTVEDLVRTTTEIRWVAQVDQWEILVRDRAAISRLFPSAPVASREDHPEPLSGTLLGIPVREDPTLGWHGEIRNKTTGQRMCYIFDEERDVTYQIDPTYLQFPKGGVNRDSSEEG